MLPYTYVRYAARAARSPSAPAGEDSWSAASLVRRSKAHDLRFRTLHQRARTGVPKVGSNHEVLLEKKSQVLAEQHFLEKNLEARPPHAPPPRESSRASSSTSPGSARRADPARAGEKWLPTHDAPRYMMRCS